MCWSLQPCAWEPATMCIGACDLMQPGARVGGVLASGAADAPAARHPSLCGRSSARGRGRGGSAPRVPAARARDARGCTPSLRSGRRPLAARGRRLAYSYSRGEGAARCRARMLTRRTRGTAAGNGHECSGVGGLRTRRRAARLPTATWRRRRRRRADRGRTLRARAGAATLFKTKAATLCIGGCNPVHQRLQPCASEAATQCGRGCSRRVQVLHWRDVRAHRATFQSGSSSEPSILSLAEFVQVRQSPLSYCTPPAAL